MAYRPGPYAPSEFMLTNFANWYAGKMEAFVGAALAAQGRRGMSAAETLDAPRAKDEAGFLKLAVVAIRPRRVTSRPSCSGRKAAFRPMRPASR